MDINSVASSQNELSEARDSILRRFEAWLNCALAEEPLPQGLASELVSALEKGNPLPPIEGHCDLYSLLSTLTVLTQEVKLQSRTFKQVSDTLAQLPNSVARILAEDSAAEWAGEAEKAGGRELGSAAIDKSAPGKQQIDLLLDLHDRFERGLNAVREASAGLFTDRRRWWRRWFGRDQAQDERIKQVISALKKGYSLTLERVDQALQDYGVTPILCQGEKFNCHRMTAVEIEENDSLPDGTVVGVYRTGYEWQGELFRSAQVKVARRPICERKP
jgi:hypothetical protein